MSMVIQLASSLSVSLSIDSERVASYGVHYNGQSDMSIKSKAGRKAGWIFTSKQKPICRASVIHHLYSSRLIYQSS